MPDEVKDEVTEDEDVEGQRLPNRKLTAPGSEVRYAESEPSMQGSDDDVEGQILSR